MLARAAAAAVIILLLPSCSAPSSPARGTGSDAVVTSYVQPTQRPDLPATPGPVRGAAAPTPAAIATATATAASAPAPSQTPPGGRSIIDDPSLVRLTALPNPGHHIWWATDYVLEVTTMDPAKPVEVSYLVTDSNGTPAAPTAGMEIRGGNFIAGWDPGKQYYFYTQVGSPAQERSVASPLYLPLPHYRTCLLVLGGQSSVYAVFLRENDGQLACHPLRGGRFDKLEVPALAEVAWLQGERFQVRSYGGPVEVGIWVNGRYQHDEVAGYGRQQLGTNPKHYYLDHTAGRPNVGMFLLMVARYERLGLIIGNESNGQIGAIALAGSHAWEREIVQGLADRSVLIPRTPGVSAKVEVRATGAAPVEVSHFAFDNSCWQWEVNGRSRPDYATNPQSFPLKHYTPAFLMASRHDSAGIYFYNENDGHVGVLPLVAAGAVR